jgi:hypothetical protein
MGKTQSKRPLQITAIVVLWFFLGLWNIWVALQGTSAGLGSWNMLSGLSLPVWYKIASPVELVINIGVLVYLPVSLFA